MSLADDAIPNSKTVPTAPSTKSTKAIHRRNSTRQVPLQAKEVSVDELLNVMDDIDVTWETGT
jgi:hypothetical protein